MDRYLADARVPIWKSLSLGQVEVYREILEVGLQIQIWISGRRRAAHAAPRAVRGPWARGYGDGPARRMRGCARAGCSVLAASSAPPPPHQIPNPRRCTRPQVYQGHSPKLEELLQCEGPFWARNYFFYHSGRPLTLIHEVFSNRLEDSLGPRYERRRTQGGPPAGAAGPPKGASAAAAQQQHKQQQE